MGGGGGEEGFCTGGVGGFGRSGGPPIGGANVGKPIGGPKGVVGGVVHCGI